MEQIRRDFRSKASVRPPWWTWGLGSKGQNSTLSEQVMLHIILKGIMSAPTW